MGMSNAFSDYYERDVIKEINKYNNIRKAELLLSVVESNEIDVVVKNRAIKDLGATLASL